MEESAACEGEGGVADGTAPVALDGVGGTPSAGEEEGEGVAEVVELVEVVGAVGLAIERGMAWRETRTTSGAWGRVQVMESSGHSQRRSVWEPSMWSSRPWTA